MDFLSYTRTRDLYINCPWNYRVWDISVRADNDLRAGFKVLEDPNGHWSTLWSVDESGRILKPRHNESLDALIRNVADDIALTEPRPRQRPPEMVYKLIGQVHVAPGSDGTNGNEQE